MFWVDSKTDLELVAALIDGRLSDVERAAVVQLLAESDEALELFAKALRARLDASRQGTHLKPEAIRLPRWTMVAPLATAAVLAIALLPTLRGDQQQSAGQQYATVLTKNAALPGVSIEHWQPREWSPTRGGTREGSFGFALVRGSPDAMYACRLGVRSVDLQLALSGGDTAQARRVTGEIIDELTAIGLSEPVVQRYKRLRSRLAIDPPGQSIGKASQAEGQLRALLDTSTFAFGQWIGAAELAARRNDVAFFDSELGGRMLRSPLATGGVAAAHADLLHSVALRLQRRPRTRNLEEVHADLQSIIQGCGG